MFPDKLSEQFDFPLQRVLFYARQLCSDFLKINAFSLLGRGDHISCSV